LKGSIQIATVIKIDVPKRTLRRS